MMRALVVVPTYNEVENIGPLLAGVFAADPQVHVLVVDDAGPDGTADRVQALRAQHGHRLHLLCRAQKDGLGSAYRAGFAWGLEHGYDVLVEMDADLSHPADRLPALLAAVDDADLVIGSRYVDGGSTRNWPRHRQWISRLGNAYVGAALRLGIRDATAGFRAFQGPWLEWIGVSELTSNGYCFQVETAYRTVRAGGRVREVPIMFTERERGASKMSAAIVAEALLRVTGWALRDLLTLRRTPGRARIGLTAPLALLLVLTGVGLVWQSARDHTVPQATATQSAASIDPSPVTDPGETDDPDVLNSGVSDAGVPDLEGPARNDSLPAGRTRTTAVDPDLIPVSLSVPAIGLQTSSLLQLGIAGDGTLEVPEDFQKAGWLKAGPTPGERGPSVIAGHVDSRTGPAVFARLDDLVPGDEIQVGRADGSSVTFTVDSTRQMPKDAFPTADVYGPVPGPALRLITCGGSFDRSIGHYRDNVVIFASVHD